MSSHHKNPLYRGITIYTTILSQIVGSPLIGLLIGRWIDQHGSTSPLFMLLGLFIGLGAGIYGTIHFTRNNAEDE
ncbi:hypothetical protein J416_02651 [Gracilibacillus halophilus YIM-C55.5]|uniref:ATP synthase protein I n=1 Tax=Gracilibacillus halophilus YIM-C55.5 TaxID=1308866 RepID=N4WUF3_9BACI|nr:AtpZ/AtpI family protein [Gracilibacillus halophilus]ENH97975.1 hypothetical protein J416_02651 [Gracilibacillus halophilus YIM-C55.5]